MLLSYLRGDRFWSCSLWSIPDRLCTWVYKINSNREMVGNIIMVDKEKLVGKYNHAHHRTDSRRGAYVSTHSTYVIIGWAYVSVHCSNVHIHVMNVFYFSLSGGYFYLKCGVHTTTSKCIHSTSLVFYIYRWYVFQEYHLWRHIHIVNVFYFS